MITDKLSGVRTAGMADIGPAEVEGAINVYNVLAVTVS